MTRTLSPQHTEHNQPGEWKLWPACILGAVTGKAVPPPNAPKPARGRRTFYLANQSLVYNGWDWKLRQVKWCSTIYQGMSLDSINGVLVHVGWDWIWGTGSWLDPSWVVIQLDPSAEALDLPPQSTPPGGVTAWCEWFWRALARSCALMHQPARGWEHHFQQFQPKLVNNYHGYYSHAPLS